MEQINKCSRCHRDPSFKKICGMWYIMCIDCERIEVNPTRERVIAHWNNLNPANDKRWKKPKAEETPHEVLPRLHGKRIPVYQLDEDGNRIKKWASASELTKELGLKTRFLESRMNRAIDGTIEYNGVKYVRDKSEATPRANGGRGSQQA